MRAQPYDDGYWENYRRLDASPTGTELTRKRCAFVETHKQLVSRGSLCDVGIGGGRFADELDVVGYDVNPAAVAWLKRAGRWHDIYASPVYAATFWDSLEHIHNPTPLLANVMDWAFVSMPIYDDVAHVLRSKHYKPDEHVWYFTREGFTLFMAWHGFQLLEHNTMEQDAGREGIESFAFRRRGAV